MVYMRDRLQAFCYWLGPTHCILLGAFILFGSFLVQLLTSIGVPFIKAFDFFRFDMSNFTFIELGMWAACNGRKAYIIPTMPDQNQPESFNCPPATWGWKTLQYSRITDTFFDHNLPKALILHPISCIFTLMAMITALVTIKRQRSHYLLPIFSFLSCIFAFCSFIVDVACFVPARSKLMGPKGYEVLGLLVTSTELGPAFWLSMTCFILDIMGNSIIIAGYGIWRYQRISRDQRRRSGDYSRDIEMKAGSRSARQTYFTNDSAASISDHATSSDKADRRLSTPMDKHEDELTSEVTYARPQLTDHSEHVDLHQSEEADEEVLEEQRSEANHGVIDYSRRRRRGEEEEDEDDGYDSAISNYDDARSEFGRSSREASRSQIAIKRQSVTSVNEQGPTRSRSVRRKPVAEYI
jgi:hypothetical protein